MKINPANRLTDSVGAVAQKYRVGQRKILAVSLVDLPVLAWHLQGELDSERIRSVRDDTDYVLGFLELREFEYMVGDVVTCSGYYEVTSSVAAKGWGPWLYDAALLSAAMGPEPMPVISDRGAVSQYARNIWDRYYKERADVGRKRIGRRCPQNRDYDYLNYAYYPCVGFPSEELTQAFVRYQKLVLSHPQATAPSPLAGRSGADAIARMIMQSGNELFIRAYDEVVKEERGE